REARARSCRPPSATRREPGAPDGAPRRAQAIGGTDEARPRWSGARRALEGSGGRCAGARRRHTAPRMAFTTRARVRFGDEDHAQIVYYPRFFHFFHCAFEDFFDQQGFPYRACLAVDRVGWPAVHAEADFERPVRFGDELE